MLNLEQLALTVERCRNALEDLKREITKMEQAIYLKRYGLSLKVLTWTGLTGAIITVLARVARFAPRALGSGDFASARSAAPVSRGLNRKSTNQRAMIVRRIATHKRSDAPGTVSFSLFQRGPFTSMPTLGVRCCLSMYEHKTCRRAHSQGTSIMCLMSQLDSETSYSVAQPHIAALFDKAPDAREWAAGCGKDDINAKCERTFCGPSRIDAG